MTAGKRLTSLVASLCAAVTLFTTAQPATAQAPYPTKPVRIIIPYAAGGFADIIMRLLADRLGERLGQRVYIENRVGGGGVVAAQAVKSSPADGYTLFVLATGTAISVALFKSLPFDAVKDFTPISSVAGFDLLLLVSASSRIQNVDDLLVEARRRGPKMNIGTTIPGSAQNLAGELLKSAAGIDATVVTYRTSPDVLVALLRDDVTVAVESYAAWKSAIEQGQVRAIASSGPERSMPNVPTSREAGLPKFEVVGWNALFAPAGTPPDVIARLNKEIRHVVDAPDFRKRVVELGGIPGGSSPEELAARLQSDIAKWKRVVEQAKIERQ